MRSKAMPTRSSARQVNPRAASSLDRKLGEKLRSLRENAGSQMALAEQVGVTFQQVQKYEKGTNRISVSRLMKIAAALDVPVQELFAVMGAVEAQNGKRHLVPGSNEMLALFAKIDNARVRRRVITLVKV
ncbi:MAG: helix-turn-helix transcriptional regulator [Alphaproteobacteria bacterium]